MATAVIVHRIPGRVRLLIREKRGDAVYFSALSESFARFANVQSARVNPDTGSVVLEFMGSLRDILQQARDDQLLRIVESVAAENHGPPASARSTAIPFNLVSGREINRMFMVGSVLVVIGFVQTVRGEWFPPALSVFWAAMEAFRMAERSAPHQDVQSTGVR